MDHYLDGLREVQKVYGYAWANSTMDFSERTEILNILTPMKKIDEDTVKFIASNGAGSNYSLLSIVRFEESVGEKTLIVTAKIRSQKSSQPA